MLSEFLIGIADNGLGDARVALKFYNLFSTKQSTQSDKTHHVDFLRPESLFVHLGFVDDGEMSLEFIEIID